MGRNDQTLRALENISQTARSFGNVLSLPSLEAAKQRRADKSLAYNIGRQRHADEITDEKFRRETEAYELERAKLNEPINIANFMKSAYDIPHFAAKTTDGEMFSDGIARQLGGKQNEAGWIIMPDGRRANQRDFEINRQKLEAYFYQHINTEKKAKDIIAEAEYNLSKTTDPKEQKRLRAVIADKKDFLVNPKRRLSQIENKITNMKKFAPILGKENVQRDIQGLERKYARIYNMWKTEEELKQKRLDRAAASKGKNDTPFIRNAEWLAKTFNLDPKITANYLSSLKTLPGRLSAANHLKENIPVYVIGKERQEAIQKIDEIFGTGNVKSDIELKKPEKPRNTQSDKQVQMLLFGKDAGLKY